ncbi:serpin family protein [Candidatus Riflebacteria bacterium]
MFSLHSASGFAMVHSGAQGDTAKEIEELLGFMIKGDALNSRWSALQKLVMAVKKRESPGTLHIASALLFPQDCEITQKFLHIGVDRYMTAFSKILSINTKDKIQENIDSWIRKNTGNKIKTIQYPGFLNEEDGFVLTTAVYFNGEWQTDFAQNQVSKETFFSNGFEKKESNFIWVEDSFPFIQNKNMQMVEIPYSGHDLSLLIILPKEKNGIFKVEKDLSYGGLQTLLEEMESQMLRVSLPVFELTSMIEPLMVLKAMGIKNSCAPEKAAFSGISGRKNRIQKKSKKNPVQLLSPDYNLLTFL